MSALPNQTPGLIEQLGLTREEVDREVWTVAGAERLSGAAAVNRALIELGGGWRLLAGAQRVPGLRPAEELIYRLIAARRGLLSRIWSDPAPF